MNTERLEAFVIRLVPTAPRRPLLDLARKDLEEASRADERAWAILCPGGRMPAHDSPVEHAQ